MLDGVEDGPDLERLMEAFTPEVAPAAGDQADLTLVSLSYLGPRLCKGVLWPSQEGQRSPSGQLLVRASRSEHAQGGETGEQGGECCKV